MRTVFVEIVHISDMQVHAPYLCLSFASLDFFLSLCSISCISPHPPLFCLWFSATVINSVLHNSDLIPNSLCFFSHSHNYYGMPVDFGHCTHFECIILSTLIITLKTLLHLLRLLLSKKLTLFFAMLCVFYYYPKPIK